MRAVVDVRLPTRPTTSLDRAPVAGPGRKPQEIQSRQSRGFIVDRQGYIVTNAQLVGGVSSLEVTLHDGRTLGATVVARDRLNDVAVLKVERSGLPVMPLGDSGALTIGERVLAIGHGDSVDRTPTVATVLATGAGTGGNLAVDLMPNPEGVGGPILNRLGLAVGIVTESSAATGSRRVLTFAVPVDRVKSILNNLTSRPVAGLPDSADTR